MSKPTGKQLQMGDQSLIPMYLDDGRTYTVGSMAGGARETNGMPDDLTLMKHYPPELKKKPQRTVYVQGNMVKEAAKIIQMLYNRLGNISPVAASEFIGASWQERIVIFMIQQGRKDWFDWTDGIEISELKKWPEDVQRKLLKYYDVKSWEEFEDD